MDDERDHTLNNITPLLEPTPSGVTKLIAAWPGLSTETRILALSQIEKCPPPGLLDAKVLDMAFGDPNVYVRCLAAKRLHKIYFWDSERREELKRRVEQDVDPLVRFCLLERTSGFLDDAQADPASFWTLPHPARLALVRRLADCGELIAKLIRYAIAYCKESVTEIELFEVLLDYVAKAEFRSYYERIPYDEGWITLEKDLRALWRLVPDVPEAASYVLIGHLPPGLGTKGGSGFNDCLPPEVLARLNNHQLEALFDRSDIAAGDLRKSKFFAADEKEFMLRGAAASHNLNLTYEEFSQVLARSPKHHSALLSALASADDLDLCLYEAIIDVYKSMPIEAASNLYGYGYFDADSTAEGLDKRMRELRGYARKTQVRELRLYRLARLVAPRNDGYQLPDELRFLGAHVVKGDVWATFMALSRAWHSRPGAERLEELLPLVEETGGNEA